MLLFLCLLADSAQTDNRPDYGDTLVEATTAEPSVLIPMLAGDSISHEVAGLIFNGLVKYAPDLSLTGDLAQSWDIDGRSVLQRERGLTITFHLRHGVTWTDGVEFTADDVMYGYKTIIDDKTPTAYKEDYLQVKKAEVVDKYTFRVTYDKPFASALSSWGNLTVLPKHLLEGKDITKNPLTRNPTGLGPYKLKRWTPGQEVLLSSNHDYFEGRPYIDNYLFRVIPDQSTMFMELKAGGIDFMGLTPLQYKRQTDSTYFRENFNKYRYPVFSYTYLGFNLKHPIFSDKRVRQAIAYAIDKREIVSIVLLGLGSESTGPYVPNTWPYNPNVKRYEYNPQKARELLAQAGWVVGQCGCTTENGQKEVVRHDGQKGASRTGNKKDSYGDGILYKDGRPLEFTISTSMGNNARIKAATIIQWRLKQIGIRVNIRVLEWSTFINEFIDKRRFEAVLLGWAIGMDADQYDIWHSSKTKEKEFNFISYSDSEVDRLLEEGRRTFDIEKRKKAYYKIQEILAEDVPYVFLYVPDALPIVHNRFNGIDPSPIGIGYNLPKWYVPKDQQKNKLEP
ncbi:MAG: peptide-binding protein [Nitrospirae bacterium]|nr:peptide-binding protein [Nitrospirota bacterium]MBF0593201.1 peptide-binding protein [Nitrospirota bacterium]